MKQLSCVNRTSCSLTVRNPDYAAATRRVFDEAPFVRELGIQLIDFAPGSCDTRLALGTRHLQQDGYVHAGVQATLADHTAGTAAATLVAADQLILTAEFKINLLRAAKGELLLCKATILKPGRQLIIAESEVYCQCAEQLQLVSKAMVTLAVADKKRLINK